MMALWLAPRNSPPPPPVFLLLVPLVFLAVSWLTNRLMGIPALYAAFPADKDDPIEENLGWNQVEFGALRGHSPMSIQFGKRCLHLKQPFPFQLPWWQGPASVPWAEVRLVKEASGAWWAFLSAAEFRLGSDGRLIRLRGKIARKLQARLQRQPNGMAPAPTPPVEPGAIRPK